MSKSAPRPRLALRTLLWGAFIATSGSIAGCDDPGPGKLFDEEGTWELTQVSLEGSTFNPIDPNTRSQAFLMQFDAKNKVVQTAMCADNEREGPTDSLCRLSVTSTQWFCSCFAYDFVEDQMAWQQFDAGSVPPEVDLGDLPDPSVPAGSEGGDVSGGAESGGVETDGGGDTDEGEAGDADGGAEEPAPGGPIHQLQVSEVTDIADTYDFTTLPEGIFASDGVASKYIMQRKAPSLFDQVFEDPDGRPPCEPCVAE